MGIQFKMFSNVITLLIISFLGCESNPVSQYDYSEEDYPGDDAGDYPGYDDPSAWVDCELPKRINTFYSGEGKPLVDCKTMDKYKEPPCGPYKTKGGHIWVCCPTNKLETLLPATDTDDEPCGYDDDYD